MKKINILFIFATVLTFNYCDYFNTNILKEGIGIENIVVDQSNTEEVMNTFGKDYQTINHLKYSYERFYPKIGLSFFYKFNDKNKTIFYINAKFPYKARTEKGIILGKSTMQDVVSIYGPPKWRTTKEDKTWWSQYNGIRFYVEAENSLPHFPLNEEIHMKKTITEIGITANEVE